MESYFCVFDNKKKCPIKTEYKLKPESLSLFCKICPIRETPSKTNQVQMVVEALVHIVNKNLVPMLSQFTETQRLLGKAQAEAQIFKQLSDDPTKGFQKNFFEELQKEMLKQAKDRLKAKYE